MSRLILFLGVIIILFSVAAGGSWYLQYQQIKDAETPHAEDKAGKAGDAKAHGKNTVAEKAPERPFARPSNSPESDQISKLAASLQAQREEITKREDLVAVRVAQMNILHEDIKKEHKRLDLVRKEIAAEYQRLEDKLVMLEKRSTDGERERKSVETRIRDLDSAVLKVDTLEWTNIKQQVKMIEKMEPEPASLLILEMVDSGKLDTAAKVMGQVRDRQAAAIFAELTKQDTKLPVQIFERMITLKGPATKVSP